MANEKAPTEKAPAKLVKHQHVLSWEKINFCEALSPTGFPMELVPADAVNPPLRSTNPADNAKFVPGSMQKFFTRGRPIVG
jgi:hypothetical protein